MTAEGTPTDTIVYRCCNCCEPGHTAYADHVAAGGDIKPNQHETWCDECQGGAALPVSELVGAINARQDDVASVADALVASDPQAVLDALTRAGALTEEWAPGILVLDGFTPGDGFGRRLVTAWREVQS